MTSNSKTESKESGYYLTDYKPMTREIKLTQHDEKIEFGEIWVESQWFYNSDICLLSHKESRNGYNVVFEFKKSNQGTFLFTLKPIIDGKLDLGNGGILEDRKEIRLSQLTDTLWLKVHEKNPQKGVGWKNEIEGQKIGFVKK